MPELPNPEHPEMNPNQSYKDFPCKLKLSLDFVFLSIVTCAGAVHLLKMPPILNPLNPEQTFNEDKAPPTGDKGLTASQNIQGKPGATSATVGNSMDKSQVLNIAANPNSTVGSAVGQEEQFSLKSDIERFAQEDLSFKKILIDTIKPKVKARFEDPFVYEDGSSDQLGTE